jgi:hypothetical protein
MVRAFPESGFVVVKVDGVGCGFHAPVPFPGRINEVLEDIFPGLI